MNKIEFMIKLNFISEMSMYYWSCGNCGEKVNFDYSGLEDVKKINEIVYKMSVDSWDLMCNILVNKLKEFNKDIYKYKDEEIYDSLNELNRSYGIKSVIEDNNNEYDLFIESLYKDVFNDLSFVDE